MKTNVLGASALFALALVPSLAFANLSCTVDGTIDSYAMFVVKDAASGPFTAGSTGQYLAGNLGGSTQVSMTLQRPVVWAQADDGNGSTATFAFVNDLGQPATFVLKTNTDQKSTGVLTTAPIGTVEFDNCSLN